MKFADWIEEEGYRKQKVAQKLGISSTTIYSILSGVFLPNLAVAVSIEKLTKGKVRCEDWLTEKPKDEKKKARKIEGNHEADQPELNIM